MLSLWSWLVGHAGIIGSSLGGIVAIIGVVLTLRGQREAKRLASERNKHERSLAEEKTRLDLQERRRQTCVPLLITVRDLATVVSEFRSRIHDNLWTRQRTFLFQSNSYAKQIHATFKTANERIAIATSELTTDPAGQTVKDTFVTYLKAQGNYANAMIKPLQFPRSLYSKADASTLDELARNANERVTALEEAINSYVNSPLNADHLSEEKQPGALSKIRRLGQIALRWRKQNTRKP